MSKGFSYQSGFGNYLQSEAKPGALPSKGNSPQVAPLGLYPEQLTGSAFTAPREQNLRSWLYKLKPSVDHSPFREIKLPRWESAPFTHPTPPDQIRWGHLDLQQSQANKVPPGQTGTPQADKGTNFLESVFTLCGHGSLESASGGSIHLYAFDRSMSDDKAVFYSSDSEIMIVPYEIGIELFTEFGKIEVLPKEIAVIPRGCKFQANLPKGAKGISAGYMLENYGAPFELPGLGPIGANGLANPRHFLSPVADFCEKEGRFLLLNKFQGNFFEAKTPSHPLNTVAWHGNYYPYKYDLTQFNTIGTVSYDHPDPSIFTVLTSPSGKPGFANIDFVIFPERWMVAEDTFRPPYFHRNLMSEYMGLIEGVYDAKSEGFVKGGGSLHNRMTAHGPDKETFEAASKEKLIPKKQENTLAFMWESLFVWNVTEQALHAPFRQTDYQNVWQGFS